MSTLSALLAIEQQRKKSPAAAKVSARGRQIPTSDAWVKATRQNMSKGPGARQAASEKLFLDCFATPESTVSSAQFCSKLGRGAASIYNSLLVLQARGVIHKAGTLPRTGQRGRPTTIWALGPKPKEQSNG